MALRRKRREAPRSIGARTIDPNVEHAVDVYMGKHGVAAGEWRSRAQAAAAVEAMLGWAVAPEDVVDVLRAKEYKGEAECRLVPITDEVSRYEWRLFTDG